MKNSYPWGFLMNNDELLKAVIEKAKADGIAAKYPPLSEEAVSRCEEQMNLKLPEMLKFVYVHVANGGVGPGEAMLPLIGDDDETVLNLYLGWINSDEVEEDFEDEEGDEKWEWIPGVIPLCYWGCSDYSVLDCTSNASQVVQADLGMGTVDFKKEWKSNEWEVFDRPGVPFEEWLSAWLDESKKWDYIPGGKPEEDSQKAPDQEEDESNYRYETRKKAEAGDADAMWEYAFHLSNYGEKKKSELKAV
ncbi:MAG: SMI1/KNR4 family protein [Candidatus Obscuribacterales bacterium]|nr:SMI1/KNR4 family protein [Candidatus Obscuribacterales bacterium]